MRYLTMNDLRKLLSGRGRTTIYRDVDLGRLPKPIKLGGLNYWLESAIYEHLRDLRDNDEK